MNVKRVFSLLILLIIGSSPLTGISAPVTEGFFQPPPPNEDGLIYVEEKPTAQDIQDAADLAREQGKLPGLAGVDRSSRASFVLDPGGIPHFFGPYANYANSPMPKGSIELVTVDARGSGYTNPQVVILDVYGTGSGATATASVIGGRISAITVDIPGLGYSAPIVEIVDPTGEGAAATAKLLPDGQSGIRKFVNALPGLGLENANELGQYLPVAIPDRDTYPGDDYYEIEIVEYTEQLHSDLPPTLLRGFRQTNTTDPAHVEPHYFGPIIMAEKDRPVRIRFTNNLPTGAGGDLFIPVDTTIMGAGPGPKDASGNDCNEMMGGDCEYYTENRTSIHLHGAFVPWISDGTPHQWFTPDGETTQYKDGASVAYVPDMWFENGVVIPNTVGQTTPPLSNPGAVNNPGDGSMTFYYNNQQSARLQFMHDHAWGITRLNVYAGMANGYLVTDAYEQDLINGTNNTGINPGLVSVLPNLGIPLVIQDKTFVDATTIAAQDPTWRWGTDDFDPLNPGAFQAHTGDLWVSSVYMPIQNPYVPGGISEFGRWHYGPWFWPPTTDIEFPPVPNEYYDPLCDPVVEYCEPPFRPDDPSPSMGMESFFDTPLVNGTLYPYLEVDPEVVRFRILNIANDRFMNLQLYEADPSTITVDGRTNTEVKMVPADVTPGFPELWPTDGREGGVPDPQMAGPSWIQLGTEGGFLPNPVVIPPQPMTYVTDAGLFNVGNVLDHSLLLGTAERADVLVDFSQYAGKTLILYNDSTAPFPAYDPRYDYHTGDADRTSSGGTPTTQIGYGPNTRTIMQIRVKPAANQPDSSVVSVDVLDGGSGYSVVPTVDFSGGGGSGAIATATGSVHRISVLDSPTGLTQPPSVQIVGGGGSGATAVANISGGRIISYTVTNGGSGYTSAPTVIVTPAKDPLLIYDQFLPLIFGGGGTSAPPVKFANAVATLTITEITLQGGGTGYSAIPNVSLIGGGGFGALGRANLTAGPAYDMTHLAYVFAKDSAKPGLFEASQPRIIMPQAAYNTAYQETMPGDYRGFVQLYDFEKSLFNGPLPGLQLTNGGTGYTSAPIVAISGGGGSGASATAVLTADVVTDLVLDNPGDGYTSAPTVTLTGGDGSGAKAVATPITYDLELKAIQDEMGEAFDEYGRMSGFLGLELEVGAGVPQNFLLYGYSSPPIDLLKDSGLTKLGELGDGTQIWKITHNGVDTHTIHIHLVNAQLINRVAWDGMLIPPDPNELGWKETIRVNPLEHTIFALRPSSPTQPFDVPNSVRYIDPSLPPNAMLMPPPNGTYQTPDELSVNIENVIVNYGWEYVWHCHLLSHEEMDMMHALSFGVKPKAPSALGSVLNGDNSVTLTWTDNTLNESNYMIMRQLPAGVWEMVEMIGDSPGSGLPVNYTDTTTAAGTTYEYQVVAINIIGLVGPLPPSGGEMPNIDLQSDPSNIVSVTTTP